MDHQVYCPLSTPAITITITTTKVTTYLGMGNMENSADDHDYEEQGQVCNVDGHPLNARHIGKGHGIVVGW